MCLTGSLSHVTNLVPNFVFLTFCSVHHIPGPTGFRDLKCNDVDRDFPRIEEAYLRYIADSKWLEDSVGRGHHKSDSSMDGQQQDLDEEITDSQKKTLKLEHDYEIIVGKMIRSYECMMMLFI